MEKNKYKNKTPNNCLSLFIIYFHNIFFVNLVFCKIYNSLYILTNI